jgi:hypothetical protein
LPRPHIIVGFNSKRNEIERALNANWDI